MFVFPVNREAALPSVFERFAVVPESPLELPSDDIEANREEWIGEWTRIVLR
jgi:thiamine transport system substrate-binding protein